MTTTQLQLRRDTTANVAAITPAQGEPIYDVTRKALVLGDGATAGGLVATPFAGTWTPQLQFGAANVGMVESTQVGWWYQIGPMVFAFFAVTLTAKGSSTGAATITGLPVAAVNSPCPVVITLHQNFATSPAFECELSSGSSLIQLGKSGGTSWAALADTDFTNTSLLQGLAIYQAAQPIG